MNAPLVFIPGWCLGRGPLQSTVDALEGQFFDLPGYAGTPLITDNNGTLVGALHIHDLTRAKVI